MIHISLCKQYKDSMDEFGLSDYNFSLCLVNDHNPDYYLIQTMNGEVIGNVVD